jgi:hypothetical protein
MGPPTCPEHTQKNRLGCGIGGWRAGFGWVGGLMGGRMRTHTHTREHRPQPAQTKLVPAHKPRAPTHRFLVTCHSQLKVVPSAFRMVRSGEPSGDSKGPLNSSGTPPGRTVRGWGTGEAAGWWVVCGWGWGDTCLGASRYTSYSYLRRVVEEAIGCPHALSRTHRWDRPRTAPAGRHTRGRRPARWCTSGRAGRGRPWSGGRRPGRRRRG